MDEDSAAVLKDALQILSSKVVTKHCDTSDIFSDFLLNIKIAEGSLWYLAGLWKMEGINNSKQKGHYFSASSFSS